MTEIAPSTAYSSTATAVPLSPVPAEQAASGEPSTGTTAFGVFAGMEVGIWEMTPGVMHDVEVDELFVVIAGSARVDFADGATALELAPGDVVHLAAGTRTLWTVRETLRKVYLTPAD